MVISLALMPIRPEDQDDSDDSSTSDTSGEGEGGFEEEGPSDVWSYRSSNFQDLKGWALRAGIKHLESVQQQVDERRSPSGPVAGSRQFLSEAGILAAATAKTDPKALEDACKVIPPALAPRADDGRVRAAPRHAPPRHAAAAAVDRMLNFNFRFLEVVTKIDFCPPALHRVGLSGLFYHAKMPAEEHLVYPPEARSVADALTRVLEFFSEDPESWKRMAEELRDLMKSIVFAECATIGEDWHQEAQGNLWSWFRSSTSHERKSASTVSGSPCFLSEAGIPAIVIGAFIQLQAAARSFLPLCS
ncbi:hypothetical protein V8D89_009803 [Ganoderma adspersum]